MNNDLRKLLKITGLTVGGGPPQGWDRVKNHQDVSGWGSLAKTCRIISSIDTDTHLHMDYLLYGSSGIRGPW